MNGSDPATAAGLADDTAPEALIDALDEELTRENVERFLAALPDETHPEYYNELKLLFQVNRTDRLLSIVEAIVEDDRLRSDVDRAAEAVRFSALYFVVSYHRRKDNTGQFELWMEKTRDEFEHLLLYRYQEAILHREKNEYPAAIEQIRPVIDELPENYPLVHGFAHNIVHGIERGLVDERRERELAREAVERLRPALDALSDNGKIYSTMGRALALDGRYDEALDHLQRAIENEDSEQTDYAERVTRYRFHQMRIQLDQYQQTMQGEVEDAKRDIEATVEDAQEEVGDLRSQVVQFIGFFAGILAVAVTSTNIAISLSPDSAARLIVVMISGLVCAFASLGLLLPVDRTDSDVVGALALGVVGLLFGLYVVPASL